MSVALFAMPEVGHVQRLRPLIAGLASRGITPHVFAHARFADSIQTAGGEFVDLFGPHPLEAADGESMPVPVRYVSFAGHYADAVVSEVERLRPSLIVYDMFAVIALVVARKLGVPHAMVLAGHNFHPDSGRPRLANDPRNAISPECHRAVEALRERHGIEDASPYSYILGLSPHLNIYGEPPGYLTEEERASFEPVAFYGSLPPLEEIAERDRAAPPPVYDAGEGPRVYASFGTVIWRYWTDQAVEALSAVSAAIQALPGARGLISLGGNDPGPDAVRSLEGPGVTVAGFVDQWQVLRQTDAFVTHHGLSSTHEAIYNRVPMAAYPFFADQPGLAERCRDMGVSVPIADQPPREPITPEQARAAIERILASRESVRERLDAAREWERSTIAGRGEVLDRIEGLMA